MINISKEKKIIELAETAALFHDIGKNELHFQKQLKQKGNLPAFIRHELVSLVFLNGEEKDKFVYETEDIEKTAKRINRMYKKLKNEEPISERELVDLLILTHHKQFNMSSLFTEFLKKAFNPEKVKERKNKSKEYKDYFYEVHFKGVNQAILSNNDFNVNSDLEELIKLEAYDKGLHEELLNEFNKNTEKTFNELNNHLYYYLHAKEILMLADHYASGIRMREEEEMDESVPWANKVQHLKEHLEKVTNLIEETYFELCVASKNEKAVKIDESLKNKNKKYAWQERAVESIEEANTPHLIFNMAGTGSGKTIANAKIAEKLGSKAVTYLTPLRTLTLQSANVYAKIYGPQNTALVIGDTAGSREEEYGKDTQEIYVWDEEKESYVPAVIGAGEISLYREKKHGETLKKLFKNSIKREQLYSKPVVVATIDYLMGAVLNEKKRFLFPMARLFKTDTVVIDELDNLSYRDIQNVLKFVYLCGVLRKHLIISTATLNEKYEYAITKAYEKGARRFKLIKANAREVVKNSKVALPPEENKKTVKCSFINDAELIKKHYSNNKFEIIDGKTLNGYIERLSEKNYVEIDGKKVSVGLVKFFFKNVCVNSALDYADFLMCNGSDDTLTKIIVYHSDLPMEYRRTLEEFLQNFLNRKEKAVNREFIKEELKCPCKEIRILIFATPVIDTGRDLDFDWGICEFRNTANLIQTAGRINRHRRSPVNDVNFLFFEPAGRKDSVYFAHGKSRENNLRIKNALMEFESEMKYLSDSYLDYNSVTKTKLYKEEMLFLDGNFLLNSNKTGLKKEFFGELNKENIIDKIKPVIFYETSFEKKFPFRKDIIKKAVKRIKNKTLVTKGDITEIEFPECLLPSYLLRKTKEIKEDKVFYVDYKEQSLYFNYKFCYNYILGVFNMPL